MSKKPLNLKPQDNSNLVDDDSFGNILNIPADVRADLDAKGLIPRWLDAKHLGEHGGYHKNGWLVYRRPAGTAPVVDFKYGTDPDGIIRRGGLILGYQTEARVAMHRQRLAQKANNRSGAQKELADQLNREARGSGIKVTATEDDE